jgi:hypothetical protein
MGTRVLLEIPTETYRRAERLAQLTDREVTEVLKDTLELSLPSLELSQVAQKPVRELSDEAVLELTELEMIGKEDARLSELLDRQQAGRLSAFERTELVRLMQVYQEGLLLKAEALAEAVYRGLRLPLAS